MPYRVEWGKCVSCCCSSDGWGGRVFLFVPCRNIFLSVFVFFFGGRQRRENFNVFPPIQACSRRRAEIFFLLPAFRFSSQIVNRFFFRGEDRGWSDFNLSFSALDCLYLSASRVQLSVTRASFFFVCAICFYTSQLVKLVFFQLTY